MSRLRSAVLPLLWLATTSSPAAPIERIWLSHASNTPDKLVVSWETDTPGPSTVEFGTSAALGEKVQKDESVTLHHVEVPLADKGGRYHYRVSGGQDVSAVHSFQGYPEDTLRVIVVGDWGYAKVEDFSAVLKDEPHLLISAGDNVASLHEKGKEGVKAFSALIDRQPALFRSVPFMPILGNHDREVTPRGPKPPAHAVYDVSAAAYREFFALPDDEWKWHFDIPEFDARFVALDLQHISDFGSTWQTCHPFDAQSEQFLWYQDLMTRSRQGFLFTLINEKQTSVEGQTQGLWHGHFGESSALITGFGYFADRARLKSGLPYYNTCLKGDGSPYKDPRSEFFAQQDNYLLLTFERGKDTVQIEFKNMKGEVLDTTRIPRRKL
ncbi:MAG TPA: metallophosphoesterase [Prosthecobacter sp.]